MDQYPRAWRDFSEIMQFRRAPFKQRACVPAVPLQCIRSPQPRITPPYRAAPSPVWITTIPTRAPGRSGSCVSSFPFTTFSGDMTNGTINLSKRGDPPPRIATTTASFFRPSSRLSGRLARRQRRGPAARIDAVAKLHRVLNPQTETSGTLLAATSSSSEAWPKAMEKIAGGSSGRTSDPKAQARGEQIEIIG